MVAVAPATEAPLVNQEVDTDQNSVKLQRESIVNIGPLAYNTWNIYPIYWRYYTHQITQTVAGNAQEVAQLAIPSNVSKVKEYCQTAEIAETSTLLIASM